VLIQDSPFANLSLPTSLGMPMVIGFCTLRDVLERSEKRETIGNVDIVALSMS
jgi:hypothetical protein